MGCSLFVRHRNGVELTYAGELLVRRARRAIRQISQAERDVGAVGRGELGLIRIGVFSSLASGFIADLIQAYTMNHANVRLSFSEGGPPDHIPAVRRHQLDIAFLAGQPNADDCDTAHLWNERLYVAMAEADELAVLPEIRWQDLQDRQFVVSETQSGSDIRDFLVRHLATLGHSPRIEQHAVHRDTLMQIVAAVGGLALTSEATVATHFPGVIYRPLAGEILPFYAIWSPSNDNPAFRRFLSLARRLSRELMSRSRVSDPSVEYRCGPATRSPAGPSQSRGPMR